VALNYIEGCPRELVRTVFYGQVTGSIVKGYEVLKNHGMAQLVINKIAILSLIDLLMTHPLPTSLQADLFTSLYRENYLLFSLKHGHPVPPALSQTDVLAIERALVSTKHPSRILADRLLALQSIDLLPGVLRLWKQAALVNIGSIKQ